MIKSIPYISPSQFYYWEKCPLKAVFYYEYKNTQFFPRHPDADLGNIIHKFYENRIKWGIKNKKDFSNKWNALVSKLNEEYKNNSLQSRYFPVQWYSNYYAVKKQLLKKYLLKNSNRKVPPLSAKNEKWIEDDEHIVAGKADRLIYNNEGIITGIIDFKTGKIFEKNKKKIQIKEVYKKQLALYTKIILQKQKYKPDTSIIDIKGEKYGINISDEYIDRNFENAEKLKNSINIALKNNNINELANPDSENCHMCNYRLVCKSYKKNFLNHPIKNSIDICGKVIAEKTNSVVVENKIGNYKILNMKNYISSINKYICIYNLYFPEKENKLLYANNNTIVKYE